MKKHAAKLFPVVVAAVLTWSEGKAQYRRRPLPAVAVEAQPTSSPTRVAVLSDSQLHNPYGREIKGMSGRIDKHAGTAIRPAELNLLGSLLLEEALRQSAKSVGKGALALYLGDAANIACGSELARFVETMDREWPGALWLAVHGNHDSFLAGNFNEVVPGSTTTWPPSPQHKEAWSLGLADLQGRWFEPQFFQWWTAASAAELAYVNGEQFGWPGACASPQPTTGLTTAPPAWSKLAAPATKLLWLAMYAAHLRTLGVVFDATGNKGGTIHGSAPLSSALARNYELRGNWVPPIVGDDAHGSDLKRSWETFVVQAIDIGDGQRLVLIDTSVGGRSQEGCPRRDFLECGAMLGEIKVKLATKHFAGVVGRVGEEQLAVIDAMAKAATSAGKKVILAGHFPIHHLYDAGKLRELMRRNQVATYYSGHTHCDGSTYRSADPTEADSWATEINLGSTTDFPSQYAVVDLATADARVAKLKSLSKVPVEYVPAPRPRVSLKFAQAMVHLAAAESLLRVDPSTPARRYVAPSSATKCSYEECRAAALSLAQKLEELEARIKADSAFRTAMLGIALGASQKEGPHCDQ